REDPEEWRLGLRGAAGDGIVPTRGLNFGWVRLVVEAAISGAGVGVGRRQLVQADLEAGRLVAPFAFELPDECAYYFVAPEGTADQPKIVAFRTWLLAEVAGGNGQ